MTPTQCADCRHYIPDPVNPAAGLGDCAKGLGMHYPVARHWCCDHEPRADG